MNRWWCTDRKMTLARCYSCTASRQQHMTMWKVMKSYVSVPSPACGGMPHTPCIHISSFGLISDGYSRHRAVNSSNNSYMRPLVPTCWPVKNGRARKIAKVPAEWYKPSEGITCLLKLFFFRSWTPQTVVSRFVSTYTHLQLRSSKMVLA